MIHSFCVRRETLFFSHFLAGFSMIAVPVLLAFLAMFIQNGIYGIGCGMQLLAIMLGSLIVIIFFYGLACLVVMLSGHGAMSTVIYCVLNFAVYGMYILLQAEQDIYGYTNGGMRYVSSKQTMDWKYWLTPVVALSDFISSIDGDQMWKAVGMMCIYLIPAAAFIALAVILYKKRELERVGDNLAFVWCRPVFRFAFGIGGSFVLLNVAGMFFQTWISSLSREGKFIAGGVIVGICGLLCFIIGEMILKKRFMVWKKLPVIQMIVVCVIVVAMHVGAKINFDRQSIPDTNSIVSATMMAGNVRFQYTDPELIKQICTFHEEIADYARTDNAQEDIDESSWQQDMYFHFSYELKSGKEIYRYYDIACDKDEAFLDAIEAFINQPEYVLESLGLDARSDQMEYMIECYKPNRDRYYSSETKADTVRIIEAVSEDIKAGNIHFDLNYDGYYDYSEDEDMTRLSITIYEKDELGDMSYRQMLELEISEQCTHVLEAIDEIGVFNGAEIDEND